MGDKKRGLYNKFHVERTDGAHRAGKKHHGCEYFVLDLDHDPHARPALVAYAASARLDYPVLANDLDDKLDWKSFGGNAAPKIPPPALTAEALYELYKQANLDQNTSVDAFDELDSSSVEMWGWMAERLRLITP